MFCRSVHKGKSLVIPHFKKSIQMENGPHVLYVLFLIKKAGLFTVSLIAFSGATPTNCGGKPLYKPFTPS